MRFLVDEMFPPSTCRTLAELGHDAIDVRDRGLDSSLDSEVAAVAVQESRILVTENAKDFAAERDLVIVCVLKARLPARGLGEYLARALDRWAANNADPYVGMHWPKADS